MKASTLTSLKLFPAQIGFPITVFTHSPCGGIRGSPVHQSGLPVVAEPTLVCFGLRKETTMTKFPPPSPAFLFRVLVLLQLGALQGVLFWATSLAPPPQHSLYINICTSAWSIYGGGGHTPTPHRIPNGQLSVQSGRRARGERSKGPSSVVHPAPNCSRSRSRREGSRGGRKGRGGCYSLMS